MVRTRSLRAVQLGLLALVSSGGCSVGSALSQPPYVDFSEFKVGESRMRVSELIGVPLLSTPQPPDHHLLDYHEFTSGTPGATRLRAIGYLAGDFFTFGLAEIVFWPAELTIARPRDFRGYFSYTPQEFVDGYRIVNLDGSVERQEGNVPR